MTCIPPLGYRQPATSASSSHPHLILVHSPLTRAPPSNPSEAQPAASLSASSLHAIITSIHIPMPPPSVTLTAPQSPVRSRSVSQPIREGVEMDFSKFIASPRATVSRAQSSNSILRASGASLGSDSASQGPAATARGRARSSSLVAVTEVGGDETEHVVDRLGVGSNENAAWVNAPGMSTAHE